MKVASTELSRQLRKDVSLIEILNNISSILNLGRYQMRVVSTVPTHVGEDGEHLLYISSTVRRFYFYDTTNSTWQFMEWNDSGLGQPIIVARVALTDQGGDLAATTLYTPAAAGMYRVSVYHLVTTAGTGTLTTTIGFTDDEGVKTVVPAANIDLSADTSAAEGTAFIRSTAAAITYTVTIAGIAGAPKFSLWIVVERLS